MSAYFKRILIATTALCLFAIQSASSQNTELAIAFNSGLYSFRGEGANSSTFYNTNTGKANNAYGAKPQLGLGVSANFKRLNSSGIILGADLGFEVLKSQATIDLVIGSGGGAGSPATGKSILVQKFINLYPFAGYRIVGKSFTTDLLLGLDLAYNTDVKEKNEVTVTGGANYDGEIDRNLKDFDFRPRAQIGVNHKKIGLYAGYALGLVNYNGGILGGLAKVSSNFLRIGTSYLLK